MHLAALHDQTGMGGEECPVMLRNEKYFTHRSKTKLAIIEWKRKATHRANSASRSAMKHGDEEPPKNLFTRIA